MENQHCIVVGMGHAAAQFVVTLRKSGWKGQISWLGNEGFLPYQRPPLSKDFLKAETDEPTYIRAAALYDKLEIDYYTDLNVDDIDANPKTLKLANGKTVTYDKLVLATGGTVRKFGFEGSDLGNIFYLRTAKDALAIKDIIQPKMKAVIIGGGYIGLEMAASLAQKGISVTVLEAESRILQRVTSPEVGRFVERLHRGHHVEILCDKRTVAFEGIDKVKVVKCADGSTFEADIVVVGIGIIPNLLLAKAAKIDLGNGVIVNEFCQSSDESIYAIGDCANQLNPFYNTRMRLESVPNAMEQANIAAKHLCGKVKTYGTIPWFWSHQYDLKWQIAGVSTGYDELVIRGDSENQDNFVAWYFKNNRLIAADCLNRPMEFMVAKKLLTKNINVPASVLGNEYISPKELLKIKN